MSRNTTEPDALDRSLRDAYRRADLPAAPADLRARVEGLEGGRRAARGPAGTGRLLGRWPRWSALAGLVAIAAVLVLVLSGLSMRLNLPPAGGGSQSPSHTAPAVSPSPTASPEPSATASQAATPSQGPGAVGFTTSGITSGWKGFSWSQLPEQSPLRALDGYTGALQLISWSGGYAIRGSMNGGDDSALWTSPDGVTWVPVTTIEHPDLVAAGPAGLVVVAGAQSPQTVWTSPDGLDWTNAGPPVGLQVVDSLAGTTAGFVAAGHSVVGSGKFATGQFSVAFSFDGVHWTPDAVGSGIAWDEVGPAVQSGDGRFFIMGGYTSGAARGGSALADSRQPDPAASGVVASSMAGMGGLWWSDDGKSWTEARFGGLYASQILFGSGGMLLWTSDRMIPGGGPDLESSTDGGKTWTRENTYGPIGAAPTADTGEAAGIIDPDGVFGSNGSILVAVKSDGRAWTSLDGRHWTSIAWSGPSAGNWPTPLWVLPRGVLLGNVYGAAE